jgi:glutamate racemase
MRGTNYPGEMDNRPIGFLDSGVGGLSILMKVNELLPDERLIYLADSARHPYGTRPLPEVTNLTLQAIGYLKKEYDVKLVVIACGTASAALVNSGDSVAVADIRVLGIIHAGVASLAAATSTRQVGVIATSNAITSGVFQREIERITPRLEAHLWPCPDLVRCVQRGELQPEGVIELLGRILQPVQQIEVDALLLGCTHFDFIAEPIRHVLQSRAKVVSPAQSTAIEVQRLLVHSRCASGAHSPQRRIQFVCSGNAHEFRKVASKLLGWKIHERLVIASNFAYR